MKLLFLLPALLLPLSSCNQQENISEEQAAQLEQKIDELNSRLNQLENSGTFETLENSVQFLEQYKARSERSVCILNIRNMHQAFRAHQGLNGLNSTDKLTWEQIIGKDKYLEHPPVCPNGGQYTLSKFVPKVGTLAVTCSHAKDLKHRPDNTSGW